MRAGLVCIAVLALVACKGKETRSTAGSQTGSDSGSGSLTGWKRIEALATPTVGAGPSKDLERATQIASENRDVWSGLKHKYPPTPLAAYPHGADALEALHAWVQAKGSLLAVPKPSEIGEATMHLNDVGALAIDSATDEKAASIVDGLYLGMRMVAEGRSFLEVQIGVSMIGSVKRKRATLAREAGGSAEELEVPALDLVRILAAEALQSRRTMDYATTPEGRKDFVDRAKQLGSDTSELLKDVTGRTPLSMIPTDEEAAGLSQFWLAALDGAQRGEPAATTIARLNKAAETAPEPAKASAVAIVRIAGMLNDQFDRLGEPSPF